MCLNERLAQILSIIVNFREILMTALPSQSHRRGNGWADGEAEAAAGGFYPFLVSHITHRYWPVRSLTF